MFKYLFILIPAFSILSIAQQFNAFGHSFQSDDSITFLTLIEKTKTELELAKKNYPSNITLSMDHSDNAARLVDESFIADDNVANDVEFTERFNLEASNSNITSKALVVATLVDEVLKNYADAIDLNFDLTNMSNLLYVIPTTTTTTKTTNSNDTPDLDKRESSYFVEILDNLENTTTTTTTNNIKDSNNTTLFLDNHDIINYANHETAKSLAMKINTLFQLYLKSFIGLDKAKLKEVTKLEDDFNEFYSMINRNVSPAEIMKKVHLDIQPTMQKLYNLKINMLQIS